MNFELNHFSARFNEKMNFQNVSPRATAKFRAQAPIAAAGSQCSLLVCLIMSTSEFLHRVGKRRCRRWEAEDGVKVASKDKDKDSFKDKDKDKDSSKDKKVAKAHTQGFTSAPGDFYMHGVFLCILCICVFVFTLWQPIRWHHLSYSQLTFNECASPSLKLKRVLAKEAGLTVHQVNMWMSLQRWAPSPSSSPSP